MARTNLPTTLLDPVNAVTAPATTAIDATNGMNIQLPTTGIPRAPTGWDLVIQYANTFAGAKSIIVRAGAGETGAVPVTYGAAFRAGKGDLSISNTTQTSYVGPFEPARFAQLDGSINVDFTAATTGTVIAFLLPHRGVTG